ncbi:MAG TPA: polynucleotide adenylyltransferase PcnB [Thermoanaerobaculia bacterium]|nr:polynucleotide adenylyltransferase PcnB [Thermoanaerobaculia bacterium]
MSEGREIVAGNAMDPAREEPQEPRVLPRDQHKISRRGIPENVLKVLYRLHRSGYRAYLCGGSVRDLLMGRRPKDFDVATDARPAEIRRLFRNSRIIGRRFRLVHVLFQDMTVEVSTFRREPESRTEEEDLLVRSDNTFGTPAQDARRRDFTVNGLFYDISNFSVIDYVGGMSDLDSRLIHVIGDPDIRFREDPVRMMRAVEFASRLDFGVEEQTWDAIIRHRNEILKASPHRVTEEILELLRRGWSLEAMELMVETGLLEPLFAELYNLLGPDEEGLEYFWRMLEVLDRTVRAGRVVSDAVLFAVLLVPVVMEEIEAEEKVIGGRMKIGNLLPFLREVIDPISQRLVLSAGMRHQIEQAFETLWRLLEAPGDRRSRWRFVFRDHFSNGMALLELYALSSGRHVEIFRQWQQFVQRVRQDEGEPRGEVRPRRRRKR